MYYRLRAFIVMLATLLVLSGCAAFDAYQLLYGNKNASHQWLDHKNTTRLPFEMLNQQIIVSATVKGVGNVRLIVDSGAAATVFFETEQTAHLRQRLGRQFSAIGMGDEEQTTVYFVNDIDISLGDVTLSGLTTLFIKSQDNPFFASSDATYIDGIIGADLFTHFTTHIDFDLLTITLFENETQDSLGLTPIPIQITNNLPYIDIQVADARQTATVPVLIDTGGVGGLLLADHHNRVLGTTLYESNALGLSGETLVTVSRLESLAIGPHAIPYPIAALSRNTSSENKNNLIGTSIVRRFNWVFDFQSKQVYISPNQYFNDEDYVNEFGATLLPHKQGASVVMVRPNTPAMQLGLQRFDVITSINGIGISIDTFDQRYEQIAKLQAINGICFVRAHTETCTTF